MSPPAPAPTRRPGVDALRGLALVAMICFHLTWDLAHFGWIPAQIVQSAAFHRLGDAIAASFFALVGVSLVLARRQTAQPLLRAPKFWRRWLALAAACAAISAASYALFPQSPIFFGVLHAIALASLLAAPLTEAPTLAVAAIGLAGLVAPLVFADPLFDRPALWWTGLSPVEPASNDFRPILPWFGVVALGVAWAQIRLRTPDGPARSKGRAQEGLAALGRRSLAIYLGHQPALFGLFSLLALVAVGPETERRFVAQCAAQCATDGNPEELCQRTCLCLVGRAKKNALWPPLADNHLNDQQKSAIRDEILACFRASRQP